MFVKEIIQIASKYIRLDPDLLCLKCLFERLFLHIKKSKCSIQKLTNSTSIQWFSQNHLNKI